jgi:deoxycytidylate deaminase
MRPSWEEYAMGFAFQARKRSEDPWVKVGACCLRKDGSTASTGYNGPPKKVNIDWSDRDKRRNKVIHAEINCLNRVMPGEGMLVAVTMMPCLACLQTIAIKEIPLVLYAEEYASNVYDSKMLFEIAQEFNITLKKIDYECPDN